MRQTNEFQSHGIKRTHVKWQYLKVNAVGGIMNQVLTHVSKISCFFVISYIQILYSPYVDEDTTNYISLVERKWHWCLFYWFYNLPDPEYLKFVDVLSKPIEYLPSAEVQLERKEAERILNLGWSMDLCNLSALSEVKGWKHDFRFLDSFWS